MLNMIRKFNRWLLNFLMSGWFFDENEKQKAARVKEIWNIYNSKRDYVSQVTWFLEKWVKEMKKDIKKL